MFTRYDLKELKKYGNYLIDKNSIIHNKILSDKIQYIKVTEFNINKELEDFEVKGINLFDGNWTGVSFSFKEKNFENIIEFIYDYIDLNNLSYKDRSTVYEFIELNNKLKGEK